ncbi:sensor histidine kinase [Arcanobacterium hippocoleae]|uniref:sensor histidine kinase n=1 Tax=Arcanobacterium hippocoleae TaxID=149017 RepID=UPI00366D0357
MMFKVIKRHLYPRASSYKLAYLLTAALIMIFELIIHLSPPFFDTSTIWVLAFLCIALAAAPWLGTIGDLFFSLAYIAIGLAEFDSSLSFPTFGITLIVAVWIINHHTIRASILLGGVALLSLWQNDDLPFQLVSEILVAVLVFTIALLLRSSFDKASESEREISNARRASREAVASIRTELAAQLHDTIAKDLAQVAILVQNMAAAHPELADEIDPITNITQGASRRLRPMIMDLNQTVAAPSFRVAVTESAVMLRSRSMVLKVEMAADIDHLLSRQALLTASLFVRETATNVLKYGQSSTSVELYVDLEGSELALMMRNQISTEPIDRTLTGGFGLANLQSRIESEGGRMSFTSTGARWIISAAIPNLNPSITGGSDE